MGRFSPVLALIAASPPDSWQLQQSLYALQIPGGRELRVFVQKVPALGHLVVVQLRHELHVLTGFPVGTSSRSRVGSCGVEPLPCGERRAHWGPNEKHRLGPLQQLASFDLLGWDREVPGLSVIWIIYCEVQR